MPLSLSLLLYPLIFMFGNAFASVLHFVIEDSFQEPVDSCLFFGCSYAKCFACILVLAAVLSSCIYFWKRDSFNDSNSTTLNIVKDIFKDCIFCLSAFVCVYYCIKTLYLYLVGGMHFTLLLKIIVNVSLLAIFMIFIAFDRKNTFYTNFKLFFGTCIAAISLTTLITILCVHKFANLEAINRVRSDSKTFHCLGTLEYETSHEKSKDDIELDLYERFPKCDIQYKVNGDNIEVKFKIKSDENDRSSTRAIDRVVYRHNKSKAKKYFNKYKQPGEYTKTFKIQKTK